MYVTIAMCLAHTDKFEKTLMVTSVPKGPVANVEPTTIMFEDRQVFLDFLLREGGRIWDGYKAREAAMRDA